MNRHRIRGWKRFSRFINRLIPILMRRVILSIGVTLLAGGIAAGNAAAQAWPAKPIRFMVGYPPGGANDILARIVGPKLAERLGRPVVVENKPGADSMIATEYVSKAPPDGHTLLVAAIGAMVFNPTLYERLSYDPLRDFIPVTLFATDPLVFAVNPSVRVTTIKELIALAKAKPGEMFYSSSSPPMHVAAELFKKQTGVDLVHIPYKGGGPSITAAVAGEVSVFVGTVGPALSHLRAGKLRPLAVTSLKRDPQLPDVPTLSESGLDFEFIAWIGLFAPAGTPGSIIDRLYSELSAILKSESMKERIASAGYDTGEMGMSPSEFTAFLRASLAKWTKVTKDLNIRAN